MPTITINGKVHTPSSGTLKKMKRKAAMEAANKKASNKPKAKGKKAPIPKERSERPKKKPVEGLRIPKGPTVTKLKGKVADLPSKKKAAMTAGADAKVKADAAREKMIKKSKGSAADIAYAKKIRGK